MGYRSDHQAQRLRVAQLEAELGEARREIAALRSQGDPDSAAAGAREAEPIRPESSSQSAFLGVGLIVLGGVVSVVTPVLPVMAAGVALATLGLMLLIVGRLIYVARPCEALVLAGRRHRLPDGSVSRFHVQVGGRVVRRPFVERVVTMDLRVIPLEIFVQSASCAKGEAVDVSATALVKVAADPEGLRNAVERFLGQRIHQLATAAQQELEATLRAAVSTLAPEEIAEDRLKVAEALQRHADARLGKLGISLVGFAVMGMRDRDRRLENRARQALAERLRRVHLEETSR